MKNNNPTTIETLFLKYDAIFNIHSEYNKKDCEVDVYLEISFNWFALGDKKVKLGKVSESGKTTEEVVKKLDDYFESFENEQTFLYTNS